jgi:hypothetical protein
LPRLIFKGASPVSFSPVPGHIPKFHPAGSRAFSKWLRAWENSRPWPCWFVSQIIPRFRRGGIFILGYAAADGTMLYWHKYVAPAALKMYNYRRFAKGNKEPLHI